MGNYDMLSAALSVPPLPITILGPSEARTVLERNPSVYYVSEWKHTMGRVRYEYRPHGEEGKELKELRDKGVKGGHPWLVQVLSRADLEAMALEEIPAR